MIETNICNNNNLLDLFTIKDDVVIIIIVISNCSHAFSDVVQIVDRRSGRFGILDSVSETAFWTMVRRIETEAGHLSGGSFVSRTEENIGAMEGSARRNKIVGSSFGGDIERRGRSKVGLMVMIMMYKTFVSSNASSASERTGLAFLFKNSVSTEVEVRYLDFVN